MSTSLSPTIDYSTRDYEGFREDLINMLKVKIPEYTDFSSSDAGIVLIELLSYGLDILSYYNDKVANELFLDTAQEKESIIKICKMLNYDIKGSTASKVYQVIEIVPRSQPFVISKGTKFKTFEQLVSDEVIFEVESDFTIPANCTGLETDESGHYLYKIPLVQGYTVYEDIIGTSNETAYQTFPLNFSPVIQDSIQISINEGQGFSIWDRVTNFIDSDLYTTVYKTFETSEDITMIEFGSGSSGKIPKRYENGIIATYRVGGGVQGNVKPNTITKVEDNLAGIVQTFNPETPYVLGVDGEGMEKIRINAPASLRTLDRAVTLQDYEDLLILRGDILKAKAKEHDTDKSIILLTVLLDNQVTLTQAIKDEIEDYFDDKKEIGYTPQVSEAVLTPLNITVTAKTNRLYKNADVITGIQDRLNGYFLLGNFDIGEDFVVSSLIAELMLVSGVTDVSVTVTNPENTPIPSNGIATLGTPTINVTGGV